MPPQLLSPAGLPSLSDVYIEDGQQADSDNSTPIAGPSYVSNMDIHHHPHPHQPPSYLSIDAAHGGLPAHLLKNGAARGGRGARAPLKRTASTASVNEHVMDMLNPHKQAEEIARMNNSSRKGRASSVSSSASSSLSLIIDDEIGTQEDWEIEVSEDEQEQRERQGGGSGGDDPFTISPPGSGSANLNNTSMLLDSGGSIKAAGVDGLSSSPTSRVARNHTRFASRGSTTRPRAPDQDMQMDMDDADNNPFLVGNGHGPPRAPSKKHKTAASHKDKISYVFRGKRITYDAPLDSLFSNDDVNDPDDVALNRKLKSGPRVLFPSPPTPPNKAAAAAQQSSISHLMATPSRRSNTFATGSTFTPHTHGYGHASRPSINMHLMQTPRRQPLANANGQGGGESTESAAEMIVMDGSAERKKEDGQGSGAGAARLIPPTPASLPQKSKKQRQIERERLQNAMRGIQAAHQAAHAASRGQNGGVHGGQQPRRYAPYPPR